MLEDEWVHDDPRIPDEAVVYRRIRKDDPEIFSGDRISGEKCLAPKAFSLSSGDYGPHGGLSGYLDYLMDQHGVPAARLVDDWTLHGIARFTVGDLREGGAGIIESVDPDDGDRGKAHALARCRAPGMQKPKSAWKSARRVALERAVYYDSWNEFMTD
ncbi:hypothetical protein [Gordonia malaquae]|uniref:hypothetical protein n=1 Tax=Gordonia malaquae TaxID=410332 RepID=UPI0030FF0403